MILSILDNDLYKFSTSYAYMKLYPEAEGTFTFTDRDDTVYNEEFLTALNLELNKLRQLRLKVDEFYWCIEHIPYIPRSNIVMKLSKCRINKNQEWRKCIKISDDLGKHLGDDKEFEIVKYQLGI